MYTEKPLPCPHCKSPCKIQRCKLEMYHVYLYHGGCPNMKCNKMPDTFNVATIELATELWNASVKYNLKKHNI